jgi:hypothetical protein
MFAVKRLSHLEYGDVIYLDRVEQGLLPLQALSMALKEHLLWQASNPKAVRFLFDEQVLTSQQLERRFENEHRELPKCAWCAQILEREVYSGGVYGNGFHCSIDCRDQSYRAEMDKVNNEVESDFR